MSYMSLYHLNGKTKVEREYFQVSPKGQSEIEYAKFNSRLNDLLKIVGTVLTGFLSYRQVSYNIWTEKCIR